jgi:hypothetical protein
MGLPLWGRSCPTIRNETSAPNRHHGAFGQEMGLAAFWMGRQGNSLFGPPVNNFRPGGFPHFLKKPPPPPRGLPPPGGGTPLAFSLKTFPKGVIFFLTPGDSSPKKGFLGRGGPPNKKISSKKTKGGGGPPPPQKICRLPGPKNFGVFWGGFFFV